MCRNRRTGDGRVSERCGGCRVGKTHVGHRLFGVSLELELVSDKTAPLLVKRDALCGTI